MAAHEFKRPGRPPEYVLDSEPGELLRGLREGRGWSQAELARRAGVSQPAVNQYESGRRTPSLGVLLRLVQALGYQLEPRRRRRGT